MVVVSVVLLVPIVTVTMFKDGVYYPSFTMSASGHANVDFLFNWQPSKASCEATLDNVTHSIVAACPSCTLEKKECRSSLDPSQRRLLSAEPLSVPSSRIPGGVVVYRSSQPDIAMSACLESDRQSDGGNHRLTTCFAPKAPRPYTIPSAAITRSNYFAAGWFAAVSGLVSWLVCFLLVRYQRFHARLSLDATKGGPQKFHAIATPRIGGVALLIGLLFTGAGFVPMGQAFSVEEYGCFVLAALPAFAGGFAEDLTKKVGVLPRLACTMASAALCAWLLAAILRRLDIPYFDAILISTPLAVAFTVFAVGGVANAVNIVDGYNGLVTGYSILVLAALGWVAAQVGDLFIVTAALSMIGALVGFFLWNYPNGRIFLGDGGAYFLGFWMAELSVLLVARHPSVSAWFPLLLLTYPVFETLFSIYRKKVLRGHSPGQPDGLHFHMLIYKRLIRLGDRSRSHEHLLRRNSMVSPYVWLFSLLSIIPASILWRNTIALVAFTAVFCAAYIWLYRSITRLNAPSWLIYSLSERNDSARSASLLK
ncbi:MAG: MraY family glycosyltransferase [Rhodospirillaceae bacterium]